MAAPDSCASAHEMSGWHFRNAAEQATTEGKKGRLQREALARVHPASARHANDKRGCETRRPRAVVCEPCRTSQKERPLERHLWSILALSLLGAKRNGFRASLCRELPGKYKVDPHLQMAATERSSNGLVCSNSDGCELGDTGSQVARWLVVPAAVGGSTVCLSLALYSCAVGRRLIEKVVTLAKEVTSSGQEPALDKS